MAALAPAFYAGAGAAVTYVLVAHAHAAQGMQPAVPLGWLSPAASAAAYALDPLVLLAAAFCARAQTTLDLLDNVVLMLAVGTVGSSPPALRLAGALAHAAALVCTPLPAALAAAARLWATVASCTHQSKAANQGVPTQSRLLGLALCGALAACWGAVHVPRLTAAGCVPSEHARGTPLWQTIEPQGIDNRRAATWAQVTAAARAGGWGTGVGAFARGAALHATRGVGLQLSALEPTAVEMDSVFCVALADSERSSSSSSGSEGRGVALPAGCVQRDAAAAAALLGAPVALSGSAWQPLSLSQVSSSQTPVPSPSSPSLSRWDWTSADDVSPFWYLSAVAFARHRPYLAALVWGAPWLLVVPVLLRLRGRGPGGTRAAALFLAGVGALFDPSPAWSTLRLPALLALSFSHPHVLHELRKGPGPVASPRTGASSSLVWHGLLRLAPAGAPFMRSLWLTPPHAGNPNLLFNLQLVAAVAGGSLLVAFAAAAVRVRRSARRAARAEKVAAVGDGATTGSGTASQEGAPTQ